MAALDPVDAMIELWRDAGHDDEALDDVGFTGSEPVLTRFHGPTYQCGTLHILQKYLCVPACLTYPDVASGNIELHQFCCHGVAKTGTGASAALPKWRTGASRLWQQLGGRTWQRPARSNAISLIAICKA
jgi:hypothetical protein